MLNARGDILNAASPKAIAKYIATHSDGGGGTPPKRTHSRPAAPPTTEGTDPLGAPPTVNSIIPDPVVYGEETAQALKAYQNALAAISARRAGTLQNYGMTAKVDANGNLQNYAIDPNNQYGLIQQLLGQEGSSIDAARHDAVARGLGTLGLGHQAESRARLAGGAAQLNLGRQFVGEIGQEASDQYSAGSAYNAAKLQAQRDAIASAIQNGYFTPAPSSASTQPPPMATQTTTKPLTTAGTLVKGKQVNPYTLARRFGGGGL